MKVSEVMARPVATIGPDGTAREAACMMLRIDAGLLPVTQDERLVGIITDRDIAVRGIANGHGPDTLVGELMTNGVVAARPDEDVADAAARMAEAQVRRLPVIDGYERLCGMLSLGDLSREAEPDDAQRVLEGVSNPGRQHRQ